MIGCRALNQEFAGWPGRDGESEHLVSQAGLWEIFKANVAYWVDGLCVHESMEMSETSDRQFVRLSLPSTAPWFEGYTKNPLGVLPTGQILPRRVYMNA